MTNNTLPVHFNAYVRKAAELCAYAEALSYVSTPAEHPLDCTESRCQHPAHRIDQIERLARETRATVARRMAEIVRNIPQGMRAAFSDAVDRAHDALDLARYEVAQNRQAEKRLMRAFAA